jgi:hypothetical protein
VAKRKFQASTALAAAAMVAGAELGHGSHQHEGISLVAWAPGPPLHVHVDPAEGHQSAEIKVAQGPPIASPVPPPQEWAFEDDEEEDLDWAGWPGMQFVAGIPASLIDA